MKKKRESASTGWRKPSVDASFDAIVPANEKTVPRKHPRRSGEASAITVLEGDPHLKKARLTTPSAEADEDSDATTAGSPVCSDPYLLEDSSLCQSALTETRWLNKQRVLVFSGRGVTHRHRHLMEDIRRLLPHSKAEPKWEKKEALSEINEVCEMQSCNNCLYFETRKSSELYLWLSRTPNGPSIKFQVLNVHTLGELKMTGNCLLYSRPLLIFDRAFTEELHLRLMKELLMQTFGTPRNHPKAKPFFDHVLSFFFHDNKIWFRHYQISPMTDKDNNRPDRQLLTEIGPRFVLDPIKIFDGSFGGATIYENPHYLTPTAIRVMASRGLGSKYAARQASKHQRKLLRASLRTTQDALDPPNVFLPLKAASNSQRLPSAFDLSSSMNTLQVPKLEFFENSRFRQVVLGTSQLCLDLCAVLKLPSQVAASSLRCFQTFLGEFDWESLELPLLVGSCILVTWKYWEDLLPIKSARKLMDICYELFRLLVIQEESDCDTDNDDDNQMNAKQCQEREFSYRYKSGALSVTDWTLRDEGKEFHRLRDRIKLYESCLLRCLNFEVGPFDVPFDHIEFLCRHLWNQQRFQTGNSASLSQFLYLSYAIVLDLHRSPFCLLSSSRTIAVAAVWKSAIALELTWPFETPVKTFLGDTPPKDNPDQKSLEFCWSTHFPISVPQLRILLQQFRALYEWMCEFEAQYDIPRMTRLHCLRQELLAANASDGYT